MEKIMILILLVLALSIAVLLAMIGVRCGGRTIPMPPKHLKPKRKCVGMTLRGGIYRDDNKME